MTVEDLEKEIPGLIEYTETMPEEIRKKAFVKVYPQGKLIHQKDCELQFFGIVAKVKTGSLMNLKMEKYI